MWMWVCVSVLLCPVMQSVFLPHDQCFQEKNCDPRIHCDPDKNEKKKTLKIDEWMEVFI